MNVDTTLFFAIIQILKRHQKGLSTTFLILLNLLSHTTHVTNIRGTVIEKSSLKYKGHPNIYIRNVYYYNLRCKRTDAKTQDGTGHVRIGYDLREVTWSFDGAASRTNDRNENVFSHAYIYYVFVFIFYFEN